jgi:prepilin-type N-terminal cleavage/methylation domain-containing protein
MRMGHGQRRQGGFSLVELLVVVGIILVLVVVTFPAIAGYLGTYRLRGGTDEVVGELQRARTTAVLKNVRQGVVFSIENDPSGRPTMYRYFIEDGLVSAAEAAALGVAANKGPVRLTRAAIIAGPVIQKIQAGTLRRLPAGIEFSTSATACPTFAPNAAAIRFGNLGSLCQPTTGSTACPDFTSGVTTNYFEFLGTKARICLTDTRSGDGRVVSMASGGRLRIEETP